MGRILQILLLAAAGYIIYRLIRGSFGPPKAKFPCATCRNCRTLYDDGVICMFGQKETFKNETHISNCRDYVKGRAG